MQSAAVRVVPLLRDHFFPGVYYNIPVNFFFFFLLRLVLLLIAPLYHYKYGGLVFWPYRSLPFYLALVVVWNGYYYCLCLSTFRYLHTFFYHGSSFRLTPFFVGGGRGYNSNKKKYTVSKVQIFKKKSYLVSIIFMIIQDAIQSRREVRHSIPPWFFFPHSRGEVGYSGCENVTRMDKSRPDIHLLLLLDL